MPRWTTWTLAPGRLVVELDDRVTAGLGLELEVLVDEESGRSFGLWTWSQTGEVLAVVAGAET